MQAARYARREVIPVTEETTDSEAAEAVPGHDASPRKERAFDGVRTSTPLAA
jgi:hypothetical protein